MKKTQNNSKYLIKGGVITFTLFVALYPLAAGLFIIQTNDVIYADHQLVLRCKSGWAGIFAFMVLIYLLQVLLCFTQIVFVRVH